ncbi:MAG TPA: hypothetical protein VFM25_11975, partial [Verrucomicrobiae bacterium]|nr:hypothetical protein [Verrucomicrobiae bacterium]
MNLGILIRIGALAVLILSGSGCAFRDLWNDAGVENFNEPADSPNLRLYKNRGQKDLLVVYDEYSERHDSIRPRAYWLFQNQNRIENRRRPDFVSVKVAKRLTSVPVFSETNGPADIENLPLYALGSTNHYFFSLYSDGNERRFMLPVYSD